MPSLATGGLLRGVGYTRLSIDEEGTGQGVERQDYEIRGMAEDDEVRLLNVFTDNDISAADGRNGGPKYRPEYQEMLDWLRRGEAQVVYITEVPRLQRSLREFTEFYELCVDKCLIVVWDTGRANFRTMEGTEVLDQMATDARKELARIQRRWRKKHRQLERQGRPNGGVRRFGYQKGFKGLMEPYEITHPETGEIVTIDEPELFRNAAAFVLDGGHVRAVARLWNDMGVSTTGTPRKDPDRRVLWNHKGVWDLLVNPAMSGRRGTLKDEDPTVRKPLKMPRILGPAVWDPIIDADTSDRLRALLGSPTRVATPKWSCSSPSLLTGLVTCGECGEKLQSRGAANDAIRCEGCRSNQITRSSLAEFVEREVVNVISSGAGAIEALVAAETETEEDGIGPARTELDEVNELRAQFADMLGSGQMKRGQFAIANAALDHREAQATARIDAVLRRRDLHDVPWPTCQEAWDELETTQKRKVIGALIETVRIRKGERYRFDLTRIKILWRDRPQDQAA